MISWFGTRAFIWFVSNLLLLPWILKLIVDMVNYSTPLIIFIIMFISSSLLLLLLLLYYYYNYYYYYYYMLSLLPNSQPNQMAQKHLYILMFKNNIIIRCHISFKSESNNISSVVLDYYYYYYYYFFCIRCCGWSD